MEKKEIMREKKTWKYGVHCMKDSSEKAIEVNNELMVNVAEQKDDKQI